MSPIIPSPTAITGVQPQGGKPSPRLPLDVFQKQHEFAFALYVLALDAWQKAGNEAVDQDNNVGTSYFQVVGVHGVPYVDWQKDPTAGDPSVTNAGYCTHRSVLFMPWHRPYLMLYEQIIYTYAEDIARQATGYAAQAYAEALQEVRLPYWDWAKNPHLPQTVMSPDIVLSVPGYEPGTKTTIHLEHNPLYSYRFTSDWAKKLMWNEMNWETIDAWTESKRCPEADGQSNQEIANVQVGTFAMFKTQTFQAITNVTDFDEFTTQAWKSNLQPSAYSSIEAMHNNIHNYTGTNDTVIDDEHTRRLGNMTDVQASSFDPIFWLHHANCDRLVALWQALNPNCTITEYPSLMDRFVAKKNTMEGGKSRLEPWHKTAAHSMDDYYIADDTKELISTFDGGYYYPETPLELIQDPTKMKAYTLAQIYDLYCPPNLRPQPPPESIPNAPAADKPVDDGLNPENPTNPSPPTTPTPELAPKPSTEVWQAFLRVRNFALTGTWAVHVFLGELPESTADWFLSENRVGSVTMLSNRSRRHCANCIAQAQNDILVTGTVLLNEALEKRGVDVTDVDAVAAFLTDNLSWKVVKDTRDVPITEELGLTVGVSAQKVSPAESVRHVPTWEESRVFPAVTAGKPGGLSEENRMAMQV